MFKIGTEPATKTGNSFPLFISIDLNIQVVKKVSLFQQLQKQARKRKKEKMKEIIQVWIFIQEIKKSKVNTE